jgi:plasmid maintenance system antidote protein VapI
LSRPKTWKIPVDVDVIQRLFDENRLSIRGIDRCEELGLSRRTVQRGLKDGEMSMSTVIKLGRFLGTTPDVFTRI